MTNSNCLVCSSPTAVDGLPYRCAYCGKAVCPDHRLPENHGCSGDRLPDNESPEGREPQPVRLEQNQTVGTTPTDTGQSSPDVATDGSVAGGDQSQSDDSDAESWWRRLLPW